MHRKALKKFIIIWCLLFTLITQAHSEEKKAADLLYKKKVLLLNSYHHGYLWTDEITRGVREIFSERNVELHVEYMDTKHQLNIDLQNLLIRALRIKHQKHQYDVIISSDNNAFEFLKKYGEQIFNAVPVVFCGVNYLQNSDLVGLVNYTGINEKPDIIKNLNLIRKLQPNRNKIIVITDNTTTGKLNQKEVLRIAELPQNNSIQIELMFDVSLKELVEKVRNFDERTAILFTIFIKDKNDIYLGYEQGMKFVCDNTSAPVYATQNFNSELGIFGGYLTNGYDQGAAAARKAAMIFSGKQVSDIPILWETPTRLRLDNNQLKHYGISLNRLPQDCEILNQPVSLYYQHKKLIWNTIIIFSLLLFSLIGVIYGLLRSKLAEKVVKQSEKKYRKLISNISDVIVIMDKDSIIKYKSPNITSQFGWEPNDLIGKHGLFMTHPDDKDRIGNQLADLIKNRQKTVRVEYDYLCKDGSYKPIELTAVNLINDPVIDGVLANYKDITERKKAGDILKQSEEKYRTMIEHSNDMIWTMDSAGNFTFLNEQAEQITEIKSEDWIGKSFAPLILDEDLSMISDVFQKSLNGESVQYELRFKKQDDRILTISVNTAPIVKNGTINGIVSFGRDITEQQELKVKLQQAQKMEAIGTLAGGIAHDFNNILSGIFGYSQLAQTNLNNPEKASQQIDQVVKGAQRATELVKQILTFSRQTEYQKQPFKIYLEVKEALKLLRSTIPTTIDIKQKLDSKAMISADPTKIHQVVINLCTNANHAMRKTGGCLTISLTDVEISEPKHLRDNKALTGNYLKLEVSDTGCGMDEKTLKMAFDPYYTTKNGAGTGLGLSIVQAIVEEHDGFLDVNSIPDKGTSFYIYFPIIEQKTRSEAPKLDKEFTLRGDETIMIVDDEETIRQSLKEGLEDYGYQIRLYQNGIEALEEFESNPNQFDLIITDMTMPEMTGDELSTKCLTVRPDIPIILCTGFSENISETRAVELGIRKFVKKPIANEEFLILIRKVLNEIQ